MEISKDLISVAGDALKTNLTVLGKIFIKLNLMKTHIFFIIIFLCVLISLSGPRVLPWSEQAKFFLNLIARKVIKKKLKNDSFVQIETYVFSKKGKRASYVPDFKKAFQHFCIHAGGRAIIDGIQENLKVKKKKN